MKRYSRYERKGLRRDYEQFKSSVLFSRKKNSYEKKNRNSKSRRRNPESFFRRLSKRDLELRPFDRERKFETKSHKNSKFRFTNIMKFDFEMTAIVIFIKKFQQITNVKKDVAILKVLSMCFKKSVLK